MANDPLWIEHAHMDKGALGRKAKKAGESTMDFASAHSDSSGKTGKQSRLAQTLASLRPGTGKSQAAGLRG